MRLQKNPADLSGQQSGEKLSLNVGNQKAVPVCDGVEGEKRALRGFPLIRITDDKQPPNSWGTVTR